MNGARIIWRRTGSFRALAESGIAYTLVEFTQLIDAGGLEGLGRVIEGMKRLQTSAGDPINVLGPDEFEIFTSGVKLHRA